MVKLMSKLVMNLVVKKPSSLGMAAIMISSEVFFAYFKEGVELRLQDQVIKLRSEYAI